MNFSYETVFTNEASAAFMFSSLLEKVSHNITEDLGHPLVNTAGLIQIRKSTNHEMLWPSA